MYTKLKQLIAATLSDGTHWVWYSKEKIKNLKKTNNNHTSPEKSMERIL